MATTIFAMSQGNDGTVQSANISIPGCGNEHVKNGPSLAVEIEGDNITLLVFGDINSKVPTHEIDMTGALEKMRTKKELPQAVEIKTEVLVLVPQES